MAHLFKSDLYPCYDLPKHLSTRKEREREREKDNGGKREARKVERGGERVKDNG